MANEFTGFHRDAFSFWSGLEKNNNRDWFQAHKDVYERACREPMKALMAAIDPPLGAGWLSRINNDIGEIQRVAAEVALAWVGNGLFLVGTTIMLAWLDLRLFLLTAVTAPLSLVALVYYRRRLEAEMKSAARNLDFERAASLRDTIKSLRTGELGLSDLPAAG